MEVNGLSLSGADARMVNWEPSWNVPRARPVLSAKDIHIWRAFLDTPDRSVQEFKQSLSTEERARAERFSFDRDGNRFIAAHGILRLILAYYLDVDPCEIKFCFEKNGKPILKNAFGETGIQFNLSHSEGLALYVFTRDRKVGVDVECIRKIDEMEQIVEQFFSSKERAFFGALPIGRKQATFFNWWTRKEAFAKATGDGLLHSPCVFDAMLDGGISADLVGMAEDTQAREWSIWDVSLAEGFVGTVVVEGAGRYVRCWEWSGNSSDRTDGMRSNVPAFKAGAQVECLAEEPG